MSAIPYAQIEVDLKNTLAADLGDTCNVTIESEEPLDSRPWVAIYLTRRDSTTQPIAAGTKHRWVMRFSIWCWCFALDSVMHAAAARDDLVGIVEHSLVKNRKFSSYIINSWLEGGDMICTTYTGNPPESQGHVAGGEIVLCCEAEVTL